MDQETALASAPVGSPSTPSSLRSRSRSSLTLDLSSLPPLIEPTPPSNTLIFTNLSSLDIFSADNLQTIRELISQTAPIHSWAPLKSFRRIIVSFFDEEAAIAVRRVWDNEAVLGERCRVYFGQPTPIEASQDIHLALPDAGKLFFISPPPSPPHGWEMKLEDAPNKMVHADDLAEALAKLRHHGNPNGALAMGPNSPVSPADSKSAGGGGGGSATGFGAKQRSRSSTLIFQPTPLEDGGKSPDLPCVTVDDMTDEYEDMSPSPAVAEIPKPIMAHTSRPPVELMHDA
ncbi:Calcipressin-domain-containing protein [Podospora appendiculata]|uniref:Calcipressin-domain-containing protein n=1 Tax=Podospora appendiculata TaxID=314037 RepID=A0AAE1C935_9PEZI|nr:Calcipressin-domain-containing protein [Podospora appendiculata]